MPGHPAELALGASFVAVLVAVSATDVERRVIPNRVLLAGAAACLALVFVGDPDSVPERAFAAAAAGGFLLLGALSHRDGMGMGDVKLGALMGLYLGAVVAFALLVAFALGAVAGMALVLRHGAGALRRTLPFGPFLAAGGVVALWVGDAAVEWYVALLRE